MIICCETRTDPTRQRSTTSTKLEAITFSYKAMVNGSLPFSPRGISHDMMSLSGLMVCKIGERTIETLEVYGKH
jgi:hypothetical protein